MHSWLVYEYAPREAGRSAGRSGLVPDGLAALARISSSSGMVRAVAQRAGARSGVECVLAARRRCALVRGDTARGLGTSRSVRPKSSSSGFEFT